MTSPLKGFDRIANEPLWSPGKMTLVLSFTENRSKLKPTDIISNSTAPSIKIYSKRFARRNR